jgi:hypothetical protein
LLRCFDLLLLLLLLCLFFLPVFAILSLSPLYYDNILFFIYSLKNL